MRSDPQGRQLLNDLQYDIVAKVAHHVCEELCAVATNDFCNAEPFCWRLHGGPGAGKSHVITIVKVELC